jgi:polar amino acid transport system permease protein
MNWYAETLTYLPFLLKGVRWTIEISLISLVVASVIGCLAAFARLSRFVALRGVATLYVDFFRTTPLLVQLIWIYYALPILLGISLTSVQAGVMGLSLYTGSFLAEIVRAGILSVEPGQRDAAHALGLTALQTMRRIIMPQALIRMLPALTGAFMNLIKDSSLTSVVAVPELMRQTQVVSSYIQRNMEPLMVAAVIYFCLTYPLARFASHLHRRLATSEVSA